MTTNFIDYVKICCRSGPGGAGSSHFRREKHVPLGGPDGGDGGRGGHIILRGSTQVWTLLHLKYRKHVIATKGQPGEGGRRTGARGEDVFLEVPLGTVAKDAETGEVLFEITEDGQEVILLEGGRGGLGNSHFKTSTNQAPHTSQPGEEGQEIWFILELKVLADVGLVGFPNAGKSTLLSVVSAAKPEIADYPFTTIVPNLGVVPYRDFRSFVMADIPGIIEGASQGKGLGLRFLRHIERNSILLFVIPSTSENVGEEYEVLLNELREYNPELLDKQRLLAISKMDLITEEEKKDIEKQIPAGIPHLYFSAVTREGLRPLLDLIWETLNASPASI
ncbi:MULTISPECIES: GTPase ObgE [unclassified Siphonobacter]|uniref:GTPase ObgE n=1 Tax=unclassified Siphonobacter TaxID=2635712 RepID=UPI000CBE61FE|nr:MULTISPECIES: GTPase ObgE [unclassified Siphonobacter]MDQ1087847.1 GTP-binding protein [Siphonobacter sp. SORGH_AS_1065]MDR6193992.1 GTP-binding protein [Siphonobacter sp. SORGH_AS_0500]PKK34652.1 GTPase ObgE [Siphonobacter sp. SORGH_AS_0500]